MSNPKYDNPIDPTPPKDGDGKYWLDDMKNVNKIIWVLSAVCAGLIISDFFYHKHVVYEFENWFGFYGFFGFFLPFVLVLLARGLRNILMRGEDYYDR